MANKLRYKELVPCMHCGAENPPTAYCCLSCFKVMKGSHKVPWWKIRFQPNVPTYAVVLVIFFIVVGLLKHWMENLDAQVTMNLKTVDYTLSFMADKKKKQALLNSSISKEKTPQELSAIADGVSDGQTPPSKP